MDKEDILHKIVDSVKNYGVDEAASLAREALNAKIDPIEVIEKGFTKGLREVGELFGSGEIFLSELIMAAQAAKAGMDVLKTAIPKETQISLGKVVIGTVEGDIHDLGKNIVAAMLEANGFEVYDLGVDIPAERFIEKVREVEADILGMSALLTTTTPCMRDVIQALKESNILKKVKVIVGGAAVTPGYAEAIGADAYAEDATAAVKIAKKLVGKD